MEDQSPKPTERSMRELKIFHVIRELSARGPPETCCSQELRDEVLQTLTLWADAWKENSTMKKILDKNSLLHEVEECLPALGYLREWLQATTASQVLVVDAAGGKGIYSLLLRFLASQWNAKGCALVTQIVLIEKVQINWDHLSLQLEETPSLVPVDVWGGSNLHEYDTLIPRLLDYDLPIAMNGIHLCKQLSPTFLSLVNLLGRDHCPFMCLAPCCLPAAVTRTSKQVTNKPSYIKIFNFESPDKRDGRLDLILRRKNARRSLDHCWRCGIAGHNREECSNPSIRGNLCRSVPGCGTELVVSRLEPPVQLVNVSNVLKQDDPFRFYCGLLFSCLDGRDDQWNCKVVDAKLQKDAKVREERAHWNSERKSVFLVASCRAG